MRLGIFGGTFDPVHYGHLLLAESCREQLDLEAIWFLPTAVPPHKQRRSPAPAAARVEMLNLAIGGHEPFSVCTYEVDRGGVNYTVDTLAEFHAQDASRELFFLMGADSLADLPTWKEPARLCQLATPVVVARTRDQEDAGAEDLFDVLAGIVDPERLDAIRRHLVRMPRVDLSSSDIRRRVAAGQSIRYRTPRAVEAYIAAQGLYRATDAPSPLASG
jgi:nicotinate-nucleotide adenylyltransferase